MHVCVSSCLSTGIRKTFSYGKKHINPAGSISHGKASYAIAVVRLTRLCFIAVVMIIATARCRLGLLFLPFSAAHNIYLHTSNTASRTCSIREIPSCPDNSFLRKRRLPLRSHTDMRGDACNLNRQPGIFPTTLARALPLRLCNEGPPCASRNAKVNDSGTEYLCQTTFC
jgi:hypothetical protein